MKKSLVTIALAIMPLLLCSTASAHGNAAGYMAPQLSGFYIGAYQGYGVVNNMLHNDGQFPMARLSFGYKAYCYQWNDHFGSINLELGIQNGKTMRHLPAYNDPTADVDLPIVSNLDPVLDLLVGFNLQISPDSGIFGLLKVGMAYRQLQFPNGNFVSSLDQVSPEVQAGFGIMLSERARLVIYYQGIYADGNVHYKGHDDGTVRVSNIPTQQAGFLGFEIAI